MIMALSFRVANVRASVLSDPNVGFVSDLDKTGCATVSERLPISERTVYNLSWLSQSD